MSSWQGFTRFERESWYLRFVTNRVHRREGRMRGCIDGVHVERNTRHDSWAIRAAEISIRVVYETLNQFSGTTRNYCLLGRIPIFDLVSAFDHPRLLCFPPRCQTRSYTSRSVYLDGGIVYESFKRGPFFLISTPNQLTVFDVYTRCRFYLFTHTTI